MKKRIPLFLVLVSSFLLISGTIDLNSLFNYANQPIPNYITKDNTPPNNMIDDRRATLGRVLFYDKNLSANNAIACASCHQQEFAFSDPSTLSVGLNGGLTGRSSMRLINARFGDENRFFWDERANSLETQTTMPIQDHVEMGFSGENGDPGFDSLITKLENIDYYQELFTFAFGNPNISENRMRRALAQFVRSIQSFDSRYDEGLAQVNNPNQPFPNFTQQENQGKQLFTGPPQAGGANCQTCHRAPEFDITPNSGNNGVITKAGQPDSIDLTNTRSPSLRDLVNPNGTLNGPLMHDGSFTSLMEVINHYDNIDFDSLINPNLDPRLRGGPNAQGQNLQLTQGEKDALVAFLGTLTGSNVYTDERWSDPFDANGNLTIVPLCAAVSNTLNVNICEGEIYEGYSQSGVYDDVFISSLGCDSIRTLVLEVNEVYEMDLIVEICEGEEYEGYTQTGVYNDQFISIDGCDSTRNLALFVLPNSEEIIEAEICEGEAYEGYTVTGIYTDIFTASNGCDSVWVLDLVVLPESHPDCAVNATDGEIAQLNIQLSPNPFNNYINIQCECDIELEVGIYNLMGQKMTAQLINIHKDNIQIATDDLDAGIYIINGFDKNGQQYFSKKLVKIN
ncbi:MAG: T9SS type A sorting domain-containing protein [Bacteroidetes bacterium]|jgi:cytochrome c peroxidase|nr:T9SS type A sorting domain-containing protein [Bacteroidota bacterium]